MEDVDAEAEVEGALEVRGGGPDPRFSRRARAMAASPSLTVIRRAFFPEGCGLAAGDVGVDATRCNSCGTGLGEDLVRRNRANGARRLIEAKGIGGRGSTGSCEVARVVGREVVRFQSLDGVKEAGFADSKERYRRHRRRVGVVGSKAGTCGRTVSSTFGVDGSDWTLTRSLGLGGRC